MPQEYTFNLESAREAHKKGHIFEWTQKYLRGEGNNSELADYLVKGKPNSVLLIEFRNYMMLNSSIFETNSSIS